MESLIAVPSLFDAALMPSLVFTLKKAVGLGAMGSPPDATGIPRGTMGILTSPSVTPAGYTFRPGVSIVRI